MSMNSRRLRCYRFLTRDDWRLMEEKAVRLTFEKDQEIFREGTRAPDLYIIRKGEVRVEVSRLGDPEVIHRLGEGEFLGIMSFLDDSPANVSVVADGDVELDFLDHFSMHALMMSTSGFGSRFYMTLAVILAQRLRESAE
ncbi:MAG: cyclic nucleotide-binding domain-containing protein [Magnetococcales bacterium]|nr:cyclic nucleotide-binding domain-containing protein [Magnetococcales bacterium]NGZ28348.1 cyclic nucleotide-binding domain-containing protein [Magnetococcales bacterium]